MKILDKQASGKNIRAAITSTIAQGRRGDVIVVQYSGHDSYVPDENGDEPDGTDERVCP